MIAPSSWQTASALVKYEDGKMTGFPNFMLMRKGAANQKDANAANQVNANKAYRTGDGRVCGESFEFMGDQHFFAAAEIEVYQL